jgi:ParD-like antitoxin of type II bacterial toxin-antitoxin system
MAGIPVRLSAQLASRAREVAAHQDRSLTEQVEHWARLGEMVEQAVAANTVSVLKTRSHDPDLDARLAFADTADGRAKAAALIAKLTPVRFGLDAAGSVVKVSRVAKSKRR